MSTKNQSTTAQPTEREIKYDRQTKDYSLYLSGRYVGSAATYSEGERILNELVYQQLQHDAVTTADDQAAAAADAAPELLYATLDSQALPVVRCAPELIEDVCSPRDGEQVGWCYVAGAVEAVIPHDRSEQPMLFAFGEGLDLADVVRQLPDLLAVLNDPRVVAALGVTR